MSEHAMQRQVAAVLPLILRPGVRFSALDHAANISPRQGAERKARGVIRGLPDLVFWWAPRMAGAIELKTDKGRLTEPQLDFAAHWQESGFLYRVCRSVDDVAGTLRAWGISREIIG